MFTYKSKFLVLYFIIVSLVGVLVYNLFGTLSQTNVQNISNNNLKAKASERLLYLDDFFNPYFTTIKAISQNKNFIDYLSGEQNKQITEQYFLSVKKSLPCSIEVKYLDINAQEIIKINGIPLASKTVTPSSIIIEENKLQNKSHKKYIQTFNNLQENEIGVSNFDQVIENIEGKTLKRPITHFGMKVYDKNGEFKGFVVLKICLKTFFAKFGKTTLYNIYIIDNNGNFLLHPNNRYGLVGDRNYTVFDAFPNDAKNIIKKDKYFAEHLYVTKIENIAQEQNLKLIMENKYIEDMENTTQTQYNFIVIAILFAIVMLPVVIYFARKPDDLEKELSNKKQIEEQKIFIETLLKNAPVPMFYKDINGVYFSINNKFTEMFGINYDDIIGKTCYDIVPHKLAEVYQQQDEELLNSDGTTQVYESQIHNTKTNRKYIVEFHKNILFDTSGNKVGIIGSVVDITESVNLKNELVNVNSYLNERVKEQTQDIADKINVISQNVLYSRTDEFGIIIDVSDAFCQLSGYSRDELIGASHNIIRHPDMPKSLFEDMWEKLKNNQPWKGEIKNKKKNGGYYWVFSDIQPKCDEQGNIIGYISVRSDITDRKKFEQQQIHILEQSKMAAMGEMIGNIAHQWRQPLSVITTIASGIIFKKEYNTLKVDDLPKDMENIIKSADYLSKTIETFRNFLKEKKEKKDICIQDKVDEILSILDATIKNHQISIINNISRTELIEINMVSGELEQVVINIINNAKDAFIEKDIENRWIEFNITKDTDKMVLSIEDSAGGIPKHILPKIFEAYFTTKHQSKGTGLGLNMSYRIVTESLGGKLYAQNSQNGAIFFIEIPLTSH